MFLLAASIKKGVMDGFAVFEQNDSKVFFCFFYIPPFSYPTIRLNRSFGWIADGLMYPFIFNAGPVRPLSHEYEILSAFHGFILSCLRDSRNVFGVVFSDASALRISGCRKRERARGDG